MKRPRSLGPLEWRGPITIDHLIENSVSRRSNRLFPPESDAIYVVTERWWTRHPTTRSGPLYVGGNSHNSDRFRTRVGDLIADMLGLYGEETGHHSGGRKIHQWCMSHDVHPRDLWLGWATARPWCSRCAERFVTAEIVEFDLLLNERTPPDCSEH
jgi:hypothetical protein